MGKLYVAGIGPGDYESMTIKARRILRECDVIIGYTVYVELIEQYFPDKEYFTTPMRKEKERCLLAFSEAGKGKTAALVCSRDLWDGRARPGDRTGVCRRGGGDNTGNHFGMFRRCAFGSAAHA